MNGPPKRLLLDTNAVVSLLRGHGELLGVVKQAEWIGVSIVSEIEFLAFPSLSQDDASLLSTFLKRIVVVDLTHYPAALRDRTIQLRRDLHLRLPDAVIVASALVQEAHLVTADRQLLGLVDRIDALSALAFDP